jgi:hypothetical protein
MRQLDHNDEPGGNQQRHDEQEADHADDRDKQQVQNE